MGQVVLVGQAVGGAGCAGSSLSQVVPGCPGSRLQAVLPIELACRLYLAISRLRLAVRRVSSLRRAGCRGCAACACYAGCRPYMIGSRLQAVGVLGCSWQLGACGVQAVRVLGCSLGPAACGVKVLQ